MSSYYKTKIFFPMMNRSIGDPKTSKLRQKVLDQASGRILEIGFGTGLNLPYYPNTVRSIVAIDPTHISFETLPGQPAVEYMQMASEAMSFQDGSFETVVCTFTLCSVKNVQKTLAEIKRVLKPGGQFIFLEHGKSWVKPLVWLQTLANPFYTLLACGCHVNRDIPGELRHSGLQVNSIQPIRFKKQVISGFYYLGAAVKR